MNSIKIGKTKRKTLPGIKHLKQISGEIQTTISFHDGFTFGGGDYIWHPKIDQSLHLHQGPNQGILWAKKAIELYDGKHSSLKKLLHWKGSGVGCWERIGFKIPHVLMFGAIPDFDTASNDGTDNSDAFNMMLQNFPIAEASGPYKFLIKSAIAPNCKFTFFAKNALICQKNRNEPLFNLNGCSGSKIKFGEFTNNARLSEYKKNNARLIYSSEHVKDITFYGISINNTFHQGINLNKSSENISIIKCHIEKTARDGVFLLNSKNAKVVLSRFQNTGDDAIAFAGLSDNAIASLNSIEGAGSYNLGGSGIRFNSSGLAIKNIIIDSALFGIIAADNSINKSARPRDLKIIKNKIFGIKKNSTVTAGIGFKNVVSVECFDNDISMRNKNTHAYRIYGQKKSGVIVIDGGKITSTKSVLYIRGAGANKISVSNVHSANSEDFILSDMTGSIDLIEILNNTSENTSISGYFRASSGMLGENKIIAIMSKGNKSINSVHNKFLISDNTQITILESIDDQGVDIDMSAGPLKKRVKHLFISP
jgi:hypothetical protein